MKTVHYIDVIIIFTYIFAVIWYGLKKGKQSSSEEYFLAGRDATWPIVGISLFAANISSSTLVGLSGDAYSTGIAVFNYEWSAVVVLIFFSIFFLPFYLRSQVYTMPEFLEKRYDSRSRYYFAFVTLIGNIFIEMAAALYACGVLIKLAFPDVPTWVIIAGLAFASAAYTIPGGLSSVIYTEVVQAILLILSAVILSVITYIKIGGWSNALAVTPPDMLSLVRPINDPSVPWLGLLFGVPILGFYFWGTNQFMVQRTLSSKDLNHGRWGALFAGLLKLPVLFIMVFPGTMARVLYNDEGGLLGKTLERADQVYPSLIFDLMPTGLLGLMLAGLLAAMASSISATLNSASTLVTMDFVKNINPSLTSKQLVTVGKIATIVLVILGACVAPLVEQFDSLFKYLQFVLAYICPPIVVAFLAGVFWKRATADGAFASFIVGFICMILLVVFNSDSTFSQWVLDYIPGAQHVVYYNTNADGVKEPVIHFLYIAPALALLSLIVLVSVSLFTSPPSQEQVEAYIWRKSMYDAETKLLVGVPWYENFRYLSVILLIITAILVISYW
ncbi:MAG: sodium:solute symporter [Microscillaceae bacterium]|nr:sodium:solute symporter [Microscillaceae bacterium]